ncbi:hypothetical protein [Spiroplasma alleghenense]|uniref:Lipoprotein n=1 Tax=Spiroplasma alleghenense TaxID=216931 RepID=A0A345Z5D1_9MOLU|nr:hypothetical protein [Spiroplasma alleghenense]AXK51810.1 hypothetical protein SALLE_v1c11400 [Spiroplasma alleghenense]
MRKLLAILASLGISTASVTTLVSCQKPEEKENKVSYEGKIYNSKEEVLNQVRNEAEIYQDTQSEFSSYKGEIFNSLDYEKMYEKILSDYTITERETLKNINNTTTLGDNQIISFLPEGNDGEIVKVYRDANGYALTDQKQAINSYLAGTKWYYSEGKDQRSYVFEHQHQIENFLFNKHLSFLKKGEKTTCYDINSFSCESKESTIDHIRRNTHLEYSLGSYKWNSSNIPNLDEMPNYLIEKYINSFTRKSNNYLNTYALNINSNFDNFFGDRIIETDLSESSFKSSLGDWKVVNRNSINPLLWQSMIISKFFNLILENFKDVKDSKWTVLGDIFDNDKEKYEKFKNCFNEVSSLQIGLDDFDFGFSIEESEAKLSQINNLDSKIKSLIFIKKLSDEVAISYNEGNEENLEIFDKEVSKIIGKIFTKGMQAEDAEKFLSLTKNNNFFNQDFVNLVLKSTSISEKNSNSKNLEIYVRNLNNVVEKLAGVVNIVGEVTSQPEIKLFSKIWGIANSLSPFENKLLQLDLGNGQFLFFSTNDWKVPLFNVSLNNTKPSKYLSSVQVINNDRIRMPKGGYFFLNSLYKNREEAILALKKYIIKFPWKFKEVGLLLDNNFEKFPERIIENKGREYLKGELEKYALDIFNYSYAGNASQEFTDGFGNKFATKKAAIDSMEKYLKSKIFKYIYVPYNKYLSYKYYPTKLTLYSENKDYIDNVLAASKDVLSTDLIKNPYFDKLDTNINLKSNFYQLYFKGNLYNFKTRKDAQYFVINNSDITKGIYNTEGNFIFYKGQIFKDIKALEKEVYRKIKKVSEGFNNEK